MVIRAREGASAPLQVTWVDSLGHALDVANVTYTIFTYDGAIRTVIGVADSPMSPTDETHRFVTHFLIPDGYAGATLFCSFKATHNDDASTLTSEMTIQVEKSISEQRLNVTL